jgi:hypothetical protein
LGGQAAKGDAGGGGCAARPGLPGSVPGQVAALPSLVPPSLPEELSAMSGNGLVPSGSVWAYSSFPPRIPVAPSPRKGRPQPGNLRAQKRLRPARSLQLRFSDGGAAEVTVTVEVKGASGRVRQACRAEADADLEAAAFRVRYSGSKCPRGGGVPAEHSRLRARSGMARQLRGPAGFPKNGPGHPSPRGRLAPPRRTPPGRTPSVGALAPGALKGNWHPRLLGFGGFRPSGLQALRGSGLQGFRGSSLEGFKASGI